MQQGVGSDQLPGAGRGWASGRPAAAIPDRGLPAAPRRRLVVRYSLGIGRVVSTVRNVEPIIDRAIVLRAMAAPAAGGLPHLQFYGADLRQPLLADLQ